MATNQSLGRLGEQIALRYLQQQGYTVVARNWRCAEGAVRGEVDLVALDHATLVICEVKTRRRADVDEALEAVTPIKQRRLRRLAGAYVAGLPQRPAELRIDVIGVSWPPAGGRARVTHLRGVC